MEDAPLEAVLLRSYSRDYFDVFFSVQDVINHFIENDLLEGKHEVRVTVKPRVGMEGGELVGWRDGWRTDGGMEGGELTLPSGVTGPA